MRTRKPRKVERRNYLYLSDISNDTEKGTDERVITDCMDWWFVGVVGTRKYCFMLLKQYRSDSLSYCSYSSIFLHPTCANHAAKALQSSSNWRTHGNRDATVYSNGIYTASSPAIAGIFKYLWKEERSSICSFAVSSSVRVIFSSYCVFAVGSHEEIENIILYGKSNSVSASTTNSNSIAMSNILLLEPRQFL